MPKDTTVEITHRLGGNYTVQWAMGMARISGADADALGEAADSARQSETRAGDHRGPPEGAAIWEALKTVYDPEIPVNIVDLGLVYSMEIKEPEEGRGYEVIVLMTLTAPGCGMGPAIAEDARQKALHIPGVESANVELVWDPPWNQDMISEEGKMQLGLI